MNARVPVLSALSMRSKSRLFFFLAGLLLNAAFFSFFLLLRHSCVLDLSEFLTAITVPHGLFWLDEVNLSTGFSRSPPGDVLLENKNTILSVISIHGY